MTAAPKYILASKVRVEKPNRSHAIARIKSALNMLQSPGRDESAVWRLASAVGFLAKDFDAAEYKHLVTDMLAKGKRGQLG